MISALPRRDRQGNRCVQVAQRSGVAVRTSFLSSRHRPCEVRYMQKIILSLPVADVSRSVEFYRHILGFELVGVTGRGGLTRARVRLGDVELLFRSTRSDYTLQTYSRIDQEDRIMLYFYVDDVARLYRRIRADVQIIREFETTLFGVGEFAIEDLDGNILSFSQVSSATSDPPSVDPTPADLDADLSER